MKQRAVVYLNGHAHGALGRQRWGTVESALAARFDLMLIDTGPDAFEQLANAIQQGNRFFVAAGGDGTTHALVNDLLRCKSNIPLEEFCLGAIGLGSSNDFHKPFGPGHAGIPLRMNVHNQCLRDLGRAQITGREGIVTARYFVVSASLGAVAEANAFFNQGDWILRRLKAHLTDGAITYAALRTLLRYRSIPMMLRVAGQTRDYEVTNLSVLKTAYLSGAFRYDTPVFPDDGKLSVNLAEGLTRTQILKQLYNLSKGRFRGQPGCHDWHVAECSVETTGIISLELDGEVYDCSSVTFDVLPEKIRLAGPGV